MSRYFSIFTHATDIRGMMKKLSLQYVWIPVPVETQIGNTMHLAEKTVKNYVSNMLTKLGMSRRTEAAVYAVKAGLTHRPE